MAINFSTSTNYGLSWVLYKNDTAYETPVRNKNNSRALKAPTDTI